MTAKIPDFDKQREVIQQELDVLQRSSVEVIAMGIKVLYDNLLKQGIETELITSELENYRKNLPDFIKEIRLEIMLEGYPETKKMH